MFISNNKTRKRIVAEDEVMVAPEATELLFESEDVAELVAEVTGQTVEVTADGDEVTFAIGEGEEAEEFTVTAEGDEEVLETSRRALRGKKTVAASRRPQAKRPVAASTKKAIRKVPSKRR